jgi:hypothetical protein
MDTTSRDRRQIYSQSRTTRTEARRRSSQQWFVLTCSFACPCILVLLLLRRPQGPGEYVFRNGTVYTGNFVEGMFDGAGTLTFPTGARFVATWALGKLVSGVYYFEDKLEYLPKNWQYCTDADRRFWSEQQFGIQFAEFPQLTDSGEQNTTSIPYGTYDMGDCYLDPKDNKLYHYDVSIDRRSDERTATATFVAQSAAGLRAHIPLHSRLFTRFFRDCTIVIRRRKSSLGPSAKRDSVSTSTNHSRRRQRRRRNETDESHHSRVRAWRSCSALAISSRSLASIYCAYIRQRWFAS